MRAAFAAAILLLQLFVVGSASACVSSPAGEVILTIDGLISPCGGGFEAKFDLAMLEALPKKVIRTANPFEQGVVTYEGVLLRDLLNAVNAKGSEMTISALNDYHADLDVKDAQEYDTILAYKREGNYMKVRDKGPLWVMFPFTDVPSLAVESRFAQAVWQVNRITVK
jgi:hypothetical protein